MLHPPVGVCKLNFDGTVFYHLNLSGGGDVLQNDKGEVIMAMCRTEESIYEVEEIEALDALRSLQLISHMGITDLIWRVILQLFWMLYLQNVSINLHMAHYHVK